MKALKIIVIITLCGLNTLCAQNEIEIKFKTWISYNNTDSEVKGYINKLNDKSILFLKVEKFQNYTISGFETMNIPIENIKTIKIRRNSKTVKGALIGAITGLVIGGITGLAIGDTRPCPSNEICIDIFEQTPFHSAGEKALTIGGSAAIIGAGIGAILCSIKVRIPINGSLKNYHMNYSELDGYIKNDVLK